VTWAKTFGDALGQMAYDAAVAGAGDIAFTGWNAGQTDFGGCLLGSAYGASTTPL
jgi:hypothetical protein